MSARLLAAVVILTLLTGACAVPDLPGDGAAGEADAADGREGGGGGGDGDDGEEGEVAWFLPPAGPESPSVNEDPAYRVLDDADPTACEAMLGDDGFFPTPPPGGFVTGVRTYHLFRAGAHLCAGQRGPGATAYQDALAAEWIAPDDPVVLSRVCNVWDAVTRIVDPGAGACGLRLAGGDGDAGGGTGTQPTDGTGTTGATEAPPAVPTEAAS